MARHFCIPDGIPVPVERLLGEQTADHVLGGGPGFTDRLSRTLRDEQGLAYTVYAHLARSADREPGMCTAYMGTSPDTRERAIAGLREQISRLASTAPEPDTRPRDRLRQAAPAPPRRLRGYCRQPRRAGQ